MKFSTVTMAFMAAAGAAPGAFASNASPSLRGYDHDNGSGSVGTPVRLLKPNPDLLPAQANTDMPDLPSEAQANANADNGKENGRPFESGGDGGCLWPLETILCSEEEPTADQIIFNVCPTEEAEGQAVGEFLSLSQPIVMDKFGYDKNFLGDFTLFYSASLLDSGVAYFSFPGEFFNKFTRYSATNCP